jgi:hypothetical protein
MRIDRRMSNMSLRSENEDEDMRASSQSSLQRSFEAVNSALLHSVNVKSVSQASTAVTSGMALGSAYSRKKDREGVSIQDQTRQLTKIMLQTGDKFVRQRHRQYVKSTKSKQNV